jgi:hypothetical protein
MLLYLFTTMAEDVETQRKGRVSIVMYNAEDLVCMSRAKDHELYTTLVVGCPVRLSASHLCLPSGSAFFPLARAFTYFAIASKEIRPRINWYNGIGLDTQYRLMSLGIPVADLPISNTMTIKTKNHLRWIKNRKMLEAVRARGQDTSHWIEYPSIHDVLFRRGGNPTRQVNLEFMALIESKMDVYLDGDAATKEKLREDIINEVQARGGKFLEYNRLMGLWVQILDRTVLSEKIYSAVYYHKKRLSAKQQPRQNCHCDTDSFLQVQTKKRRRIGEGSCCNNYCLEF